MNDIPWGYVMLAAMLIASVAILAWGAALARRRDRENPRKRKD